MDEFFNISGKTTILVNYKITSILIFKLENVKQ